MGRAVKVISLPNDDHSRLSRIGATGEDVPMTLEEACRVIFKDAITPATLKAEARRGNLVLHKIGRAYFVTLLELSAMWGKCCVGSVSPNRPPVESNNDARAALASAARLALHLKLRKPAKPARR